MKDKENLTCDSLKDKTNVGNQVIWAEDSLNDFFIRQPHMSVSRCIYVCEWALSDNKSMHMGAIENNYCICKYLWITCKKKKIHKGIK